MPTPPEPEKVTLAFAKALQKLRKRTGLSQEDLAHQADIDRAYMSALERGLHNPTIGLIFRLVIPLRVSPAEFVAEMERQLRRLNAARNIG